MNKINHSSSLLSAQNISLKYPNSDYFAVSDASLDIKSGERVALIGSSGSGKTSLLRIMEGSLSQSSGKILGDCSRALVYQDHRLILEKDVLTNVCAGALARCTRFEGILGFSKKLKQDAETILQDLGMLEFKNRLVGSLSGGQKQRVAIARALAAKPDLLLADEPFASLDPDNSKNVMGLLLILQQKYHFALVLSTHDQGILGEHFPKIMQMDKGSLAEKKPDNMVEKKPANLKSDQIAKTPENFKKNKFSKKSSIFKSIFTWLVILVALFWSLNSLKFNFSVFGSFFSDLSGFSSKFLPKNLTEFLALPWDHLLKALIQTIQMAIIGTIFGIFLSLPFSAIAAKDIGVSYLQTPVRFLLNSIRTIPSIFWALLFVAIVGLGPISGVFALACYSTGYLTKFFYENFEDVDFRPAKALKSLGANGLQSFTLATFPAAKPLLWGSCFFMFEYNIRSASILGVVGAGGIGQDLMYYIEWRQFPKAFAGLFLILIVVVLLDFISQKVRDNLAKKRGI